MLTILMADDDADDRMLVRDALVDSALPGEVRFVENGEALLDYLNQTGDFAKPGQAPRPNLILLDLNMPRKDGREVLQEIKADVRLQRIPVIVLTTSRAHEDMEYSYALGANAYVVKPPTYDGLVKLMRALGETWSHWAE